MKFIFIFLIGVLPFNSFCCMWNLSILHPQNDRPRIIDLKNKLDAVYTVGCSEHTMKNSLTQLRGTIQTVCRDKNIVGSNKNIYNVQIKQALKSNRFLDDMATLRDDYLNKLKRKCEQFLKPPLQEKHAPIQLPQNDIWNFDAVPTINGYQYRNSLKGFFDNVKSSDSDNDSVVFHSTEDGSVSDDEGKPDNRNAQFFNQNTDKVAVSELHSSIQKINNDLASLDTYFKNPSTKPLLIQTLLMTILFELSNINLNIEKICNDEIKKISFLKK